MKNHIGYVFLMGTQTLIGYTNDNETLFDNVLSFDIRCIHGYLFSSNRPEYDAPDSKGNCF